MLGMYVLATPGETRGDGVVDMITLALKLMEKDKGDKGKAELRTALLKAQLDTAEGQAKTIKDQAKITEVGARADFLTNMLVSGVLSEEKIVKVRNELFSLSGC